MAAALFTCPSFDHLGGRLVALTGDTPPAHYWRAAIGDHTSTKGLETASEDSASRSWIFRGPYGWSGKDFVRAIHLRTGNLPTRAIPSNPLRSACAGEDVESRRLWPTFYNAAPSWVVEEEPHVRHPQGQLFKPDLVVHRQGLPSVVCDVQVSWDGYEPLAEAWRNKSLTYDPPPSALQRRDVGPERPLFISWRFSEPEAFGLVVMR
ncbi:hypothetical protein QE152_g5682 [Popillia japonica]|uniref:Uncharacterized protein n=1 Tax=Popillia japonica TaxID=7064 RepID=A0AAW1MNV5_POPJA